MSRKAVIAWYLFFFVLFLRTNGEEKEVFSSLVKKIDKNTVSVICENGYRGTGIVVKRGDWNYVITDAHVVDSARKVKEEKDILLNKNNIFIQRATAEYEPVWIGKILFDDDGEEIGRFKYRADIIKYNEKLDIAVLRLQERSALSSSANFSINKKVPKLGTSVFHVGIFAAHSGQNGVSAVSCGTVSQLNRSKNGQVFDMITTVTVPGCSGGGVYTMDGKCIGMVVYGLSENLILINPIRTIEKWANTCGIGWIFNEALPVSDGTAVEEDEVMETEKLTIPPRLKK